MNDFQIDLGDLMPGFTAAVSEPEMCFECGKDEVQIGNHCFECAGDLIEMGLQEAA